MAANTHRDNGVLLKPIMRGQGTSFPTSPNNSTLNSIALSGTNSVETLDPIFVNNSSTSKSEEEKLLKRNEAIIKHFELDKEFKSLASKGDSDDPIYAKVKCVFPKEFDFSDNSGSETEFSDDESIKNFKGVSRRDYEGRKVRRNFRKSKLGIVRRSQLLDFLNPAFMKRVSFDTVNKIIDDADAVDLFEESMRMNLLDDGGMGFRHGAVDPLDFARGRSAYPNNPSLSISPSRALSPGNDAPTARYHSPHRLSYGGSKIVDIDSFVITRIHKDFESLYDQKQLGPKPVLPGRIIMVYISGRKHTWVALDWLFRCFVENGDTVIVVAAVNPFHAHFRARSVDRSMGGHHHHHHKRKTARDRIRHKNSPEHVREVTANIMKYCLSIADPDLVIKITVELSVGTAKMVLKDMYDLYKPSLLVTSAKRRMETFPAVAWRSSKIGDQLVRTYPVPVILVPAHNMDLFEFSLFLQLKQKYQGITAIDLKAPQKFQKTKLNSLTLRAMMDALKVGANKTSTLLGGLSDEDEDDDEEGSVESDQSDQEDLKSVTSSIDSESSGPLSRTVSGNSSILDLRKACQKIENDLEIELQVQDKSSPDYFRNLLTNVSDASREIGIRMAMIERNDGAGASLIRTITGAPPSKTRYKSMLDVGDPTPITKLKTSEVPSRPSPLSFTSGNLPRVEIEDENRRKNTTLKFDIDTPIRERMQRQIARKSFSGSPPASGMRPELQPLRSSPQINGSDHQQANAEKDKMRKNKFASFFKFGRK